MGWDEVDDVVVLFGGRRLVGSTWVKQADTWVWNGSSWTLRAPPNGVPQPPARNDHDIVTDPVTGRPLLLGASAEMRSIG